VDLRTRLSDIADDWGSEVRDARRGGDAGSRRRRSRLLGTIPNNRNTAFVCNAGSQVEDIDATLDPALPMPVPPAPLAINNAGFSYRATFEIEGRTFKMHREFISRVAGQTCQPELEAQIAGDINALRGNVNMSFVFHRAWPPAAAVATATPASLTAPTAVTRVRLTPVAATTAPSPGRARRAEHGRFEARRRGRREAAPRLPVQHQSRLHFHRLCHHPRRRTTQALQDHGRQWNRVHEFPGEQSTHRVQQALGPGGAALAAILELENYFGRQRGSALPR
jgi:hypothetical protein